MPSSSAPILPDLEFDGTQFHAKKSNCGAMSGAPPAVPFHGQHDGLRCFQGHAQPTCDAAGPVRFHPQEGQQNQPQIRLATFPANILAMLYSL